jgi:hypothetical protein
MGGIVAGMLTFSTQEVSQVLAEILSAGMKLTAYRPIRRLPY